MQDMPAGWYRKPDDRRQHGYWDGNVWLEPHEVDSEIESDVGIEAEEPPADELPTPG
jgi:hypothetical protein